MNMPTHEINNAAEIMNDLRMIGREIDRLKAQNTDAHRLLAFALRLFTDEQMREYTDFVGGVHIYETEEDA